MKYLLALLFALSTLQAQDLSANETKDLLTRLAAKRGNAGIQADFRDFRRWRATSDRSS